jgi:hypothetical protein
LHTILLDICFVVFEIVVGVEGNIPAFCTGENIKVGL